MVGSFHSLLAKMVFNLRSFVENPKRDLVEGITRLDWIALAKWYGIDVHPSASKSVIVNSVCGYFMDKEILPDADCLVLMNFDEDGKGKASDENGSDKFGEFSGSDGVRDKNASGSNDLTQEQMQFRLQLKQKEIELKQLEIELLKVGSAQGGSCSQFNVDHAVKSVPLFEEAEVDAFFLQFEKVAVQRNWPKETWSTLVQSSFRGRAREIYAAMSLDDALDYNKVKQSVLKGYEWVSEKYRVKFRTWSKKDDVTYAEFARKQRMWFERWIMSRNINNDYDKLEELLLLEQFKNCVHPNTRRWRKLLG